MSNDTAHNAERALQNDEHRRVVVPSHQWSDLPNGMTAWQESGDEQTVAVRAWDGMLILPNCGTDWRVAR